MMSIREQAIADAVPISRLSGYAEDLASVLTKMRGKVDRIVATASVQMSTIIDNAIQAVTGGSGTAHPHGVVARVQDGCTEVQQEFAMLAHDLQVKRGLALTVLSASASG